MTSMSQTESSLVADRSADHAEIGIGTRVGGGVDYEARLGRVTAYIYDHLDDPLDLQKLADVAYLSPYHWHRVYHALNGETIAATVKRLRLHRAAGYLAHTSMPIEQVAQRSGYANLQSFTRIFKSVYGMPPAHYRKNGTHAQFQVREADTDGAAHEVVVRNVPQMHAVAIEHIGSYMSIGKAFGALYGCLGSRGLYGPGLRSMGVYYDDPYAVAEEQLRSRACVVTSEEFAAEAPLVQTTIAGGPYAVLRHQGPYATMKAAYQWLYGVWLVDSGREGADAPVCEEYLNDPRTTPPTELLTDIYLPLK